MAENFFLNNNYKNVLQKPNLHLHNDIVIKLDGFLQSNKVPNLLFHGSSGSGKRTVVNNFINKIYNNDKIKIKRNVMSVNCSHGKGIKFIREELKFFAKSNLQSENGVNFKTIILLNADSLTTDAQSALRRCIELFSYNTRFFIIVENKHKLLVPILSRFCEIYVPEQMENNNLINLHDKFLKINYNIEDQTSSKEYVNLKMKNIDLNNIAQAEIIEFINDFYKKGISCIDLMDWISSFNFTNLLKSSIILYYEKIKLDYRSEQLLMFTIFNFLLYNKDKTDITFS